MGLPPLESNDIPVFKVGEKDKKVEVPVVARPEFETPAIKSAQGAGFEESNNDNNDAPF